MSGRKVLVVGSGGREHALCWKLSQSPRVGVVYCAPGNAGISQHATCVPVEASDIEGLFSFALENGIDLTIVGPEAPLAAGLVDRFASEGLTVFGPDMKAAEIESSKVFTKDLLVRAGVPSGAYRVFTDPEEALAYIKEDAGLPIVLKADGLAAGKGVVVAANLEEAEDAIDRILVKKEFGAAGDRLIVEECLVGEEASFMAITDGKTVLPLATSQDHKAVFDGDKGPNTGGMGAYSPAPVVTGELFSEIMHGIMRPTIETMAGEGRPYKGVLYAGLMIDDSGPKVLEFNCRFGDPEAQPILMRLRTDLMEVIDAALEGRLEDLKLEWDSRACVCVVMASGGYPGSYEKGKVIHGLDEVARMKDVMVFHAGTARRGDDYVTAGGRVLGVTALGDTIEQAISRAYEAVEKISWDGVHYRRDIGKKALMRSRGKRICVFMGSESDREVMRETCKVLDDFGVGYELRVVSAHRNPDLLESSIRDAEKKGTRVFIAGAGMAAHLAGAVAARTRLPVIGVPLAGSSLNGLDALLSTVQMPSGVPVATMAIGQAGARNAAYMAVQILALTDEKLADALRNQGR